MPRRATSASPPGLLLVEAVLCAVVIAVGLVFISRGFSSSLSALRAVEDFEQLLGEADGLLRNLEAIGLADPPLPGDLRELASVDQPGVWSARAELRTDALDDQGRQVADQVRVSGRRREDGRRTLTLTAVWPGDWIPQAWR